MQRAGVGTLQIGEIVEGMAFTIEDLARACGVAPEWVQARVESGVLQAAVAGGAGRFDSITVVRARRVLQLETVFDADPQLAALTADLIEEVTRLRRRLLALGMASA